MSRIRKLTVLLLITGLSGLVFAQGGATGAISGTVQGASVPVLPARKWIS
jgi:hypothetical protein